MIRSFSMALKLTRHLADHTIAEILGRIDNIESVDWTTSVECVQYTSLSQTLRSKFAKALRIVLSGHTLMAPDAAKKNPYDGGKRTESTQNINQRTR